jgi:digeranylgeranylglycerophospholipid reductase
LKVLVVGASVAGLSCAESILVNNPSVEVTVIDKKTRVGMDVRCACGVSLLMAERVGVSIPEFCVATRIRRIRIYAPSLDFWELKGDYGYILNRELFERDMARRVERLGGKMVLAHYVTSKDLEFWQGQYDFIVGADGSESIVRRWLRLPKYCGVDLHLGVQKTVRMGKYPQDTIELYFGEKVAPEGYAWIFPAGDTLVRAGLGVPVWRGWRAHQLLDNFMERQAYEYKELGSVAKIIPTAKMPETSVYGKVVLVGDALPSTDPLTGGGIMQGIASGRAAGRAIAEEKPEKYDEYIRWLRRENRRRYRLKRVLYSFTDEDYNDLIRALRGFEPKSMSVAKNLGRASLRLLMRKPWLLRKFFKWFR